MQGKILVAEHDGVTVLKLIGDVRLTLCTSFDAFIESMFGAKDFVSVTIDVCEAEGMDSTTLGLLAKIAIKAKQQHDLTPTIISTNPSITRLLESMCFQRIFDIRSQEPESCEEFGEIAASVSSEAEVQARVLEAHKTLMGVSEENAQCFRELVHMLEQQAISA
jgi:anti-anti-sigma factor